MESFYFKHLNIPTSFKQPLSIHSLSSVVGGDRDNCVDPSLFPSDLINFIDKLGLYIDSIIFLFQKQSIQIEPHTDGSDGKSFVRLNFVFGGEDSVVEFLKLKPGCFPNIRVEYGRTRNTARYGDCDIIHSYSGPYVGLFDCGHTLHTVIAGEKPRWLYIFQLKDKRTKYFITQDTVGKYFSNYIIG